MTPVPVADEDPVLTATPRGPVRVLVCDDQADIRRALRDVIGSLPGFDVTAEAATGPDCCGSLGADPVDLVVLDVNLPGGGPELAARIRAAHPDTAIVVFSAHGEPHVRRAMLDAGADEYVVKTGRLAPLREALLRRAPGR